MRRGSRSGTSATSTNRGRTRWLNTTMRDIGRPRAISCCRPDEPTPLMTPLMMMETTLRASWSGPNLNSRLRPDWQANSPRHQELTIYRLRSSTGGPGFWATPSGLPSRPSSPNRDPQIRYGEGLSTIPCWATSSRPSASIPSQSWKNANNAWPRTTPTRHPRRRCWWGWKSRPTTLWRRGSRPLPPDMKS